MEFTYNTQSMEKSFQNLTLCPQSSSLAISNSFQNLTISDPSTKRPDYLPPLTPRPNPERIIHLTSQVQEIETYLFSITKDKPRLLEIRNSTTLVPSAQRFLDGISSPTNDDLRIAQLLSQRSRLVVYLEKNLVLPLDKIPPSTLFLLTRLPTTIDTISTLLSATINYTYQHLVINTTPNTYIISRHLSHYITTSITTLVSLPFLSDSPFPESSSSYALKAALTLLMHISECESTYEAPEVAYTGVTGICDFWMEKWLLMAIEREAGPSRTGFDFRGAWVALEEFRNCCGDMGYMSLSMNVLASFLGEM